MRVVERLSGRITSMNPDKEGPCDPIGIAASSMGSLSLAFIDASVVAHLTVDSGVITTVAGTGEPGYSGDGGPAVEAQLSYPVAVALDGAGNLFISDSNNCVVRRVDQQTGVITTVAGTGEPGYSGDGGLAVEARLHELGGLGLDGVGNLYIADLENSVVRRVDQQSSVITTVAGTGEPGYSGDGGPAVEAQLSYPVAVALDGAGNLFISDSNNCVVRRVDQQTGVITTVAGTGEPGYSGDGGLAVEARLRELGGLGLDGVGNLYIADLENSVVRRVDQQTSVITTVAGTGEPGYSGDGGPAVEAQLSYPVAVALDGAGNLFIAEAGSSQRRQTSQREVETRFEGHDFRS